MFDLLLTQRYIRVKHFVNKIYEKENGQAEDWHAKCQRRIVCGSGDAPGRKADQCGNTPFRGRQTGLATESVAFRCGE